MAVPPSSHPLRALIVDDEQPARQRLRGLVRTADGVDVAGVCAGGQDALDVLDRAYGAEPPIDLVFLDVQMPEVDGFDVLDALYDDPPGPLPVVVFVTAYDRYALQAFDAHAVDYLLKPYSDERFEIALERAKQFARSTLRADLEPRDVVDRMRALLDEVGTARAPAADDRSDTDHAPPYLDRIVLKERGRVRLLPTDEIRWIGAADVYVEIHTLSGETHLHRALLGELEDRLDPQRFVRIHRSHLVRIDAIEELLHDSHGTYTAVLDDGTMLKLSRTYRERVQERLGQSL